MEGTVLHLGRQAGPEKGSGDVRGKGLVAAQGVGGGIQRSVSADAMSGGQNSRMPASSSLEEEEEEVEEEGETEVCMCACAHVCVFACVVRQEGGRQRGI